MIKLKLQIGKKLENINMFFEKGKRKFVLNIITVTFISLVVTSTIAYNIYDEEEIKVIPNEVSLLSDIEFESKIRESINEKIDGYLREYSEYYSLDASKVVEFARSITDNYNIDLNEVNGSIKVDSTEGKALLFVYYLSKDKLASPLKNYDLSSNYFKVSSSRVTMGRDQILRNGLTFSQFLGKVCDNLGVDKYYPLAISYLETGKNTSSLALNKNNFGGLRGSGEYFSYPSPEVGIIAFVLNLKGYEKYNLSSIYELSGIYTHGNKSNPSYTWVSSVQKYYNQIVADPSKYFIVEDI